MENFSYEKALEELQQIVADLEKGTVSIDDLSAKTERAALLIEFCKEKLRRTESNVNNLLKDS